MKLSLLPRNTAFGSLLWCQRSIQMPQCCSTGKKYIKLILGVISVSGPSEELTQDKQRDIWFQHNIENAKASKMTRKLVFDQVFNLKIACFAVVQEMHCARSSSYQQL
jgi:hypothetical protein